MSGLRYESKLTAQYNTRIAKVNGQSAANSLDFHYSRSGCNRLVAAEASPPASAHHGTYEGG